jgi:hypothetical protein
MTNKMEAAIILVLTMAMFACSSPENTPENVPENTPEESHSDIRYLSPEAFPELPKNIAEYLRTEGYAIPQSYWPFTLHNVIQGAFASPGQKDWAVLASKNESSSIIVFWNGSTENMTLLATRPDSRYKQYLGEDIGVYFSRVISTVDKTFIVKHNESYTPTNELPPIDHEGIDDYFLEKGSVVHYFYEGKWLKLTGAD